MASDVIQKNNLGWINTSVTENELAEIMSRIIKDPGQIIDINSWILKIRSQFFKSMKNHCYEIESIYQECIDKINSDKHAKM